MKIGLMGFEFESENKGCEALSYSFLSLISQISGEKPEIFYFSNLGMGYVPITYPNLKFHHIPLKIKDPKLTMIRAMRKCDIIFDVTMGDSFSDIYSKEVCLSDMRFKRLAEVFSKKYILMPQTYGPFYDEDVKKKASKILVNADKVYCRDEASQKYLEQAFRIHNSILVTDLAFFLPYDTNLFSFSQKKKIGINVSGLLWRGGFTQNNQFDLLVDYQYFVSTLIKRLLSEAEYEIHLIPHVINLSENAHDDDYKVCEELNKAFPSTVLAPIFKTPIEAKSYIANMDLFIGARMHSTIAAFSSEVPTIPVSYSRKFEGLFNSLNYKYTINCRELTTNAALEQTLCYIKDVEQLKNAVELSQTIIRAKCENLLTKLISDYSQN